MPHMMSKSEQIARMLLDRIVEEKLQAGDFLGTEAELLEQFQVSRPTIREGLRILQMQGVLTLRPGPKGGIIIARPSIDVLAHSLSVLLSINSIPFSAVLQARLAIEPILVRDAALYGTEADFAAMDASITRLEAAGADGQAIYTENRTFHNLIAHAAHNPVLEVFWSTIRILASGEGMGLRYTERNRQHIIASHRAIVAALRNRAADTAQRLIVEHLSELEDLLRRRHRHELQHPAQLAFRGSAARSIDILRLETQARNVAATTKGEDDEA